jgi:hypothetical protein
MTTQVTLTYTAFLGGATAGVVAAQMAAVPVPQSVLDFYGCHIVSDATPAASPVVRTIVLGLNPVTPASATAALETNDSGSPVGALTVTAAGSGYVAPPIVSFTGGRPADVVRPGFPTLSIDVNQKIDSANSPAVAFAYLKIVSASVAAAGAGYSANTYISVIGKLSQNGTPAVLTPTIVGGHITGVAITDAGTGYIGTPSVEVIDPAVSPGSGGIITISMGVGELTLSRGGGGYSSAPTVVLTPIFQANFPPTGDQGAPFAELMTTMLEQAIKSPVVASDPVVA